MIQDTQQTLWSTAQWPRKKTRRTMSFCAYAHSKAFTWWVSPPFGDVRTAQAEKAGGQFFFFCSLCVSFSPTLILYILFSNCGDESLFTIRGLPPAAESDQPVTVTVTMCLYVKQKSLWGHARTHARRHSNRPSASAELNYNTANSV